MKGRPKGVEGMYGLGAGDSADRLLRRDIVVLVLLVGVKSPMRRRYILRAWSYSSRMTTYCGPGVQGIEGAGSNATNSGFRYPCKNPAGWGGVRISRGSRTTVRRPLTLSHIPAMSGRRTHGF